MMQGGSIDWILLTVLPFSATADGAPMGGQPLVGSQLLSAGNELCCIARRQNVGC